MDYILYYCISSLIKNSPRLILVPSNNFETMEKVAAKKPSYNARLIELIFNWTKILINNFDFKLIPISSPNVNLKFRGIEWVLPAFNDILEKSE